MTRGGAWAWPRSVRMLVSRRPLRSEYTNSRSVSFTVTLREGSSKATEGSGLDFTTHRHCTVSRAAAQWDSRRITGATAGARSRLSGLQTSRGWDSCAEGQDQGGNCLRDGRHFLLRTISYTFSNFVHLGRHILVMLKPLLQLLRVTWNKIRLLCLGPQDPVGPSLAILLFSP